MGVVDVECPRIPLCTLLMGILLLSILSERGHTGDTGMNWVVEVDALGQLTF